MALVLVYVTNPSLVVARRITRHLLKKKLIACANLFPASIYSMYLWKGKLAQGKEYLCILKTSQGKFKQVKAEIEKMHPYEVPCIIKIQASANKAFEKWVKESIR